MRLKQYFTAFIASLGGFALGTSIAWNSNVSYQMKDTGDSSILEIGLVGLVLNIGACFGSLLTPCILVMFSHTTAIFFTVPVFLIGWSFICFSRLQIIYMMIGRLICGICGGILCVLTPLYIAEIADKESRSRLLTFFHSLINCGIMYAFFIAYVTEEHHSIWQYSLICAMSCAPIVLINFLPESPLYHLSKGDEIRAKMSLKWHSDKSNDFNEELKELKSLAVIYKSKASYSQFKNAKVWQSFFTCFIVIFVHQFSLINILIYYAVFIIESKYPSDLETSEIILIIGFVQIISSILGTILIDLFGRRSLLVFSSTFMAIFLGLLGWFMNLQKEDYDYDYNEIYSWVPLTWISLYFAAFNLGVGPLTWTLPADSFPVEIKVIGASVLVFLSWTMSLIAVLVLYALVVFYGAVTTVWVFAAFSWIGSMILLFFVQETKGKSLADIQLEFNTVD